MQKPKVKNVHLFFTYVLNIILTHLKTKKQQ